MATKKTTTRSKSTKAAAKPAAKPAAKTKKAAAAAAPAEAAEVAVRGTDSPVLKESHACVFNSRNRCFNGLFHRSFG